MKITICAIALGAMVSACASVEGVTPDLSPALADSSDANVGQVSIHGIEPSRVLGSVDTQALLANSTIANGGESSTSTAPGTATSPGIAVEGAQASAVLGAIDPTKLVGDNSEQAAAAQTSASGHPAEVQAVIDGGKRYTTQDLALAQLEALRAD